MSTSARTSVRLAALGVTLMAGLLLLEGVARAIGTVPRYEMLGAVVELDTDVLFRVRPGSGPDINSLGFRDREPSVERDGRRRIVVAGDSFVMGHNVPVDRTMSRALERNLGDGYEVINMGAYGYGPDQSLMRIVEQGLDLEPGVVLLGVFAANDFNDLFKNRLFLLDATGLVTNPNNPVDEALPTMRSTMLVRRAITGQYLRPEIERPLFERLFVDTFDLLASPDDPIVREKLSLMHAVLQRFAQVLDERGIRFGVFTIPAHANVQNEQRLSDAGIPRELHFANEDHVARLCRGIGIEHLALKDLFLARRDEPLYDPGDRHLSVVGNELVGSTLAEFVHRLDSDRPEGR